MKMSKIQLLSRLHFIIKDILNTQLLFRIFQLVFEKVIKETKIKTICRPNQFTTNCIVGSNNLLYICHIFEIKCASVLR